MDRLNRNPALVYLKPGELYASREPALVTTVLGSCVSAVLFHPNLRIGTICHALLPVGTCDDNGFKYLDCAFYWMLDWFDVQGVKRSGIEVKLFGGSDVLTSQKTHGGPESVGQKNIQKAVEIIERERLKLVAHDVGGTKGRRICFHIHTGRVQVKHHSGVIHE